MLNYCVSQLHPPIFGTTRRIEAAHHLKDSFPREPPACSLFYLVRDRNKNSKNQAFSQAEIA
jgi:hypothetical protein